MIVASTQIVEHIVLYDVSWEAYERLLESFGDRRLRHSYDDGTLEIMSPLKLHESGKKFLARMVETASIELGIEIQSIGSTTLRDRPDAKGLEPDECYYIQHEAQVRGRETYDPTRDPPPDLAIEVDVTHATVNRPGIYARLGVPEIWVLRSGELTFFVLQNGAYSQSTHSVAFPVLTSVELGKFLATSRSAGENAALRKFVDWIRAASVQP